VVVCLGKRTDSSETRGYAGTDCRYCYRTGYQRPSGSVVSSQEMYPSANILAFAVQAHAEPRGDRVTAALKGRRPEGFWHSHVLGEHMRHISRLSNHNGRPFHHSLCTLKRALARLRSGLLFSLHTSDLSLPRREHTRNDTATMASRYGWYFQPRTAANASLTAASDRAASCSYRVGPRVLRQHFGALCLKTLERCRARALLKVSKHM